MKLWDKPSTMLIRVSLLLLIAFFVASPAQRHAVSATLLPKTGFTATQDARVLAQQGVPALAQMTSQALDAALQQVQKQHGYSIDKAFKVYIFASEQDFSRLGACPLGSRGCAFRGHIALSPKLQAEPDTVAAILTHELSHVLLAQRMGNWSTSQLPPWFSEGLAVFASDGAGAEGVGKPEAMRALSSGEHFIPHTQGSLFRPRTAETFGLPHRLFYRQSALFIAYMQQQHPAAFADLMLRLHTGSKFDAAYSKSFSMPIETLWAQFLQNPAI